MGEDLPSSECYVLAVAQDEVLGRAVCFLVLGSNGGFTSGFGLKWGVVNGRRALEMCSNEKCLGLKYYSSTSFQYCLRCCSINACKVFLFGVRVLTLSASSIFRFLEVCFKIEVFCKFEW